MKQPSAFRDNHRIIPARLTPFAERKGQNTQRIIEPIDDINNAPEDSKKNRL
jgi:hypothetical protein